MIDKTLQEYPSTFGAVCVDEQKWCGTIWTLSYHDGAGRNGKLRIRPMSLYKSGDSSRQVSLKKLCAVRIGERGVPAAGRVFVVPVTALKD